MIPDYLNFKLTGVRLNLMTHFSLEVETLIEHIFSMATESGHWIHKCHYHSTIGRRDQPVELRLGAVCANWTIYVASNCSIRHSRRDASTQISCSCYSYCLWSFSWHFILFLEGHWPGICDCDCSGHTWHCLCCGFCACISWTRLGIHQLRYLVHDGHRGGKTNLLCRSACLQFHQWRWCRRQLSPP